MAARGRPNLADENPYNRQAARRGNPANPADVSPYQGGAGATRQPRGRPNSADQSPYPGRRGINPADQSPYPGRRGVNPADQSPYPGRRGINPADQSPYPGRRGINPADQSPYRRGSANMSPPPPPGRGAYNPADQSPYRTGIMAAPSGGSTGSIGRRPRARPPPLETVTPQASPLSSAPARVSPQGQKAMPLSALDSGLSYDGVSKPRSPSRALDMGPAEVRLHAENAQAVARLHAEHSQRIAQLLMGTIECRPAEIEGGPPEVVKPSKSPFLLFGGCCGTESRDGVPSAAAMSVRRSEVSRLTALHAQALAKQESLHQRQKALLQVDKQRKDLAGGAKATPMANSTPMAPNVPAKPAAMALKG